MGTHPSFSNTGPSASYTPRTTDDSDGSIGGTILPHVKTRSTAGLGALTAVPTAVANGTSLGTFPTGATGARLYLPSGASLTFTIAATQPVSPPSLTFTLSNSTTGPNWDENLYGGQMIYVTAVSGSPLFRWI